MHRKLQTPEEISLSNPPTQTKSLKVLTKQQFNTFPASVPCITPKLMPHPAVQTHTVQISPSWLQLAGTSEEQHENGVRTRQVGQKENQASLGQGVFQQNSLFDQLVQPLSVQGRYVFLAGKFEDFVSNSLVIKLLEGSTTQLFLVYPCKITQCNSCYKYIKY